MLDEVGLKSHNHGQNHYPYQREYRQPAVLVAGDWLSARQLLHEGTIPTNYNQAVNVCPPSRLPLCQFARVSRMGTFNLFMVNSGLGQ